MVIPIDAPLIRELCVHGWNWGQSEHVALGVVPSALCVA